MNSLFWQKRAATLLIIAGGLGFTFVALGAFAAHGLKATASAYHLDVFNTGVLYQALHTFAIIGCAILIKMTADEKVQKGLFRAAICFIIGILCFSGSLYGLALTGIKWFGPVTPFGGGMFLVGWGILTFSAFKINGVTQ